MYDDKILYFKRRYRHGRINYLLMLLVATFFLSIGIVLIVTTIADRAPVGLISVIPFLGFGVGFGVHSIKILLLKKRSIKLIDDGKCGRGKVIRLKSLSSGGGGAYQKFAIVFKYKNDSGAEKKCSTDYVFYGDEIFGIEEGCTVPIKYNEKFAIVVDTFKTFKEANSILKSYGEEYLNNDRTLGVAVKPKINKFLKITRVATIVLILIFIALLITSIKTRINIFFYIGCGLLVAGLISFGVIFSVLIFGKNKK